MGAGMSDFAVRAANLGKAYKLYARPADRLYEALLGRPRHTLFRALEGVTFELPRGRSLGIIGENGAGKSTLLKLIAGTAAATEGTVETRGSVASILELGMGFHPEFTGEENARINAALLGLSAGEIRQRLPAMREFSELDDFFERPVRTYSSGMLLRLAFAVATHVNAEVLIVDEALAVGDGYFQKKCVDRVLEFRKGGGSLLFCSHAMYYIAMLCDEAVWFEHGRTRALGPSASVVAAYEAYLEEKERRGHRPAGAAPPVPLRHRARITGLSVHDGSGFPRPEFAPGETVVVDVEFTAADASLAFHVLVGIDRADGVQLLSCDTRHREGPITGRTRYRVRLTIPDLPVTHGNFNVTAFVGDETALCPYDQKLLAPGFSVRNSGYAVGLLQTPVTWSLEEPAEPAEPAADLLPVKDALA